MWIDRHVQPVSWLGIRTKPQIGSEICRQVGREAWSSPIGPESLKENGQQAALLDGIGNGVFNAQRNAALVKRMRHSNSGRGQRRPSDGYGMGGIRDEDDPVSAHHGWRAWMMSSGRSRQQSGRINLGVGAAW